MTSLCRHATAPGTLDTPMVRLREGKDGKARQWMREFEAQLGTRWAARCTIEPSICRWFYDAAAAAAAPGSHTGTSSGGASSICCDMLIPLSEAVLAVKLLGRGHSMISVLNPVSTYIGVWRWCGTIEFACKWWSINSFSDCVYRYFKCCR